MPEIELTETFIEQYQNQPAEIKKIDQESAAAISRKPPSPSLQSKPIEGEAGIYEVRVDQRYRITYERLSSDVLRMRGVGKQDEVLRVL
jgi:hypothetical protein